LVTRQDLPERFLLGPEAAEALRIIQTLQQAGFTAYLAGGCVRDAMLGKPPKDYDVATNATPDAVRAVFGKSRTLAFGSSFGVIGVLPPRAAASQRGRQQQPIQPTEVATFRSDGFYSDGRRPDSVHFGDAKHDALRRDFTINGLFFDPIDDRVIDYVGGQQDLKSGILRTIGDPLERFGEDKLRMLRAVRFATTLGFRLETGTLRAIVEHASDISAVSAERIGAEMRRVLLAGDAVRGLRHLIACGLDRTVFPEVEEMDLGRAEQLLAQATSADLSLRLACLLTLVEQPERGLAKISRRWRLSNEETRRAAAALKHWPAILSTRSLAWSEIQPLLISRDAATIVDLAAAIAAIEQSDQDSDAMEDVAVAQQALSWPAQRLNPPPLITGDDLRALGIAPGPEYSAILRAARADQLDGKLRTRAEAIARIERP
jgi:tRNA nucleotidyltransferase (CCA-adding enzyme)